MKMIRRTLFAVTGILLIVDGILFFIFWEFRNQISPVRPPGLDLLLGGVLNYGLSGAGLCVVTIVSLLFMYGWLPFLAYGLAKRCKGEGGKWQLGVAGAWGVLIVACILMIMGGPSYRLFGSGYLASCLEMNIITSAWIPLLIWGCVRWSKKKAGGKRMTAIAGGWLLLLILDLLAALWK
ncbi:MAG: hypothetical protein FWG50_09235 [Kiritimatiellaeota bacterium]|nr:hypothetical protein [Kiritimatiellota bacterium]